LKTILLTGGAGYIGSHTAVHLLDSGYDVVLLDNLCNSDIGVIDRIEQITGKTVQFLKVDVADEQSLYDNLIGHEIDAVIHFAALKAVGESTQIPLDYYRSNVSGTQNILRLMERRRIKHLIFSSSATVYGKPNQLPINESEPFKPASSPYGSTKQICETMIREVATASSKMKAMSLRYFNPIGAHKSGLIGELPLGVPNNLMPFITQTAIGLRDQLSVFGNDFDTSDGTAIRDYIHVVDLAEAHVLAMEYLMNKADEKYDAINLGTGNGSSVLEVIESFERSTGINLNYSITERRAGDVEQLYASTEMSTKKLGWVPKHSLDEMTGSAWKWEKNYRENIAKK